MATRMYQDNSYVTSGLITGTQWDVMLGVMNAKTGCDVASDSSSWGNYQNTACTITRGYYCTSSWASVGSSYEKSKGSAVLLSTGSNASFEKYHIYDVAGNLCEWTQEMYYYNTLIECFEIRGAHFGASNYPARTRGPLGATNTYSFQGFRVVLYMM
jgi:formylglycine-generating enzyme required for sulfatase activity